MSIEQVSKFVLSFVGQPLNRRPKYDRRGASLLRSPSEWLATLLTKGTKYIPLYSLCRHHSFWVNRYSVSPRRATILKKCVKQR